MFHFPLEVYKPQSTKVLVIHLKLSSSVKQLYPETKQLLLLISYLLQCTDLMPYAVVMRK